MAFSSKTLVSLDTFPGSDYCTFWHAAIDLYRFYSSDGDIHPTQLACFWCLGFSNGENVIPALAQVLLFLPNIVGYLRISLLLAVCLVTGTTWPHGTLTLFLLNFSLDALDGYLARHFSQVAL